MPQPHRKKRNKHGKRTATGVTQGVSVGRTVRVDLEDDKDAAEVLASTLGARLYLKDEVAEAVSGLKGHDLAKALHKEVTDRFKAGAIDDTVPPDCKEAMCLMQELRCATPGPEPIPQPLLPYIVWEKLEREFSYINGRVDLGSVRDVAAIGKLLVDITDSCMNRVAENIDLLKSMENDPSRVAQPFVKIPGLNHASKYTTTDEMCMLSFLVRNIVPFGLNLVTVKASSLHGNGVFAKRPIKKGDIITMYPCHAFSLRIEEGVSLWATTNGEKMLHTTQSLFAAYSATIEPTRIAIAGDPDVYTNDACGHLINDGACILRKDFGVEAVLRYVEDSLRAQNCHFIPLAGAALAVVASRNIQTGEEVLSAYGPAFWSEYAHGKV